MKKSRYDTMSMIFAAGLGAAAAADVEIAAEGAVGVVAVVPGAVDAAEGDAVGDGDVGGVGGGAAVAVVVVVVAAAG